MAKVNASTIMAEPRTLYLEGIRTKYAAISITTIAGGYSVTTVTLPFDARKKAIRAIRSKTTAQTFFGNGLFLLSEGELVGKNYSVSPTGPVATFTFNGIAGNLAFLKYASMAMAQGGPVPAGDSTLVNNAFFAALLGESVGALVDTPSSTDPAVSSQSYKAPLINKNVIAAEFEKGLTEKGGFDMPAAFRKIAARILYADIDPASDRFSGIIARGAATTPLSTVDHRFRLIDSIVGATDQELIAAFYGAGRAENDLNLFLANILGENITGEHSVMEVFRLLAERAYHGITEMVAPPFVQSGDVTTGVLGRMMVVPRLFSADPPVCNVFLRRMTSGLSEGVTALKTTRLVVSQDFPFFNNTPTQFLSVAPKKLEQQVIGGDSKSVKLFASLTQEESEIGVLAQHVSNLFGSSAPLDGDDTKTALLKWYDKTNPLRFIDVRTEGQVAQVKMEFNPFVAVGFPGVFFDPFLGTGRGFVKSVTHSITPSSASTVVMMDHCVFTDAMEYTPDSGNIETGFDGALKSYQNGAVSEFYEKTLGCKSLMKSAASFGFKGATIAEVAEDANKKLSASARTVDDKSAIYGFITRSIASYQDLFAFYNSGSAEQPKSPPASLPFQNLYIDVGANKSIMINIDPLDKTVPPVNEKYVVAAPKTEDAIRGTFDIGADKYQVHDRVSAVKEYVKEID